MLMIWAFSEIVRLFNSGIFAVTSHSWSDPKACQIEPDRMLDVTGLKHLSRSGTLMGMACHRRASVVTFDRRNIVDREFGEDYRDAQFPSGWYVLPLAGAGALMAAVVGFFF
jgi:hypothetical protein